MFPTCTIEMSSQGVYALSYFLRQAILQELETRRIARVGYTLLFSGCSARGTFPRCEATSFVLSTQQKDGGWSDVEETLWCLGYLVNYDNEYDRQVSRGLEWLELVQLPCKGWGRSERDQPRIPITALAAMLVPGIVNEVSLNWLAQQWKSDFESPTQLTYKAAFFLLASEHDLASYDTDLVNRTIAYLIGEQEEDGGFGPWKGHPTGSDPWCTGIALWGLSKVRDLSVISTIKRALSWLESKQLPSGLWPYHYLDDGTAMALIGISSVLPLLRE